MRFLPLFFLSICLGGCASFESIVSEGMEKAKFAHSGVRNEMSFSPIYYNPKSGIEIVIPDRGYFNSSGQIVIFEDVSNPYPKWWLQNNKPLPLTYCKLKEGYLGGTVADCMNWGDGKVKSWMAEEAIAMKALQGDKDAELLLAVIQLYRDNENSDIENIMTRESVSRDDAERIYKRDQGKLARDYRDSISDQFMYEIKYKRKLINKNNNNPNYSQSHRPSKSDSLFEYLMFVAIDAYVDKALGINTGYSGISDEDLKRIEDASRKGMRKALQKNKRMQQVYKNLSTPPPIR